MGLENAAARGATPGHRQITHEELLALDPDWILVSEPLRGPTGTAGDGGGASGQLLREDARLASLRAVREDAILTLPARLFGSSSLEMIRAAEVLEERLVERSRASEAAR